MFGVDAGESGDAQILADVVSLDDRPKALPGARVVASSKGHDSGALELLVTWRARHFLDGGDRLISRHRRQKAQGFPANSGVGIVAGGAHHEIHRLRICTPAQQVDRGTPQARGAVITPREKTSQNWSSRSRIGPRQGVQSFRTYGEVFAVASSAGLRGSGIDKLHGV